MERAVQTMEQYLRTLKSALDERMGVRIDTKHPPLTWLCEYAGYLVNRLEVSADGKTAYERCRGKRSEVMGLEFGERVLWKYPMKGPKMEKINARWGCGLFIGVRVRSNELIIVDQETHLKGRRVYRELRQHRYLCKSCKVIYKLIITCLSIHRSMVSISQHLRASCIC